MMKSDTPKCLVTGATGLLGSRLVDLLVASGVSVRAFVRQSSDTRHLINQGVELHIGECSNRSDVRRAVEGADMVFHLAGYLTAAAPFTMDKALAVDNGQGLSGVDGASYQVVNVDFTEMLLDACLAAGCGRFVFASSSSVYALDVPVPTPEEASLSPFSAYGHSKLLAEEAVRVYQDRGLPAAIVRPPVIYGPGDRHFTPLALRLSRLPVLPLVNGGQFLMDLVYVGDVVELMWRAAVRPEAIGRVYNAGSGQPPTLSELVRAFRRLTGKGPRILPVSPEAAERSAWLSRLLLKRFLPGMEFALSPEGIAMMNRDLHLSMARAALELDFQPRYALEDGLKKTLEIPS